MSTVPKKSLRVACDLGRLDAALDPRTNLPPIAIRGGDLLLQLAAFRDGAIVSDMTNVETLTAIIRAVADDGTLGDVLVTESIAGASLTACTEEAWEAASGQHGVIAIDGDDLNLEEGRYKLIVYAITADGALVPWTHCTLNVIDVGLVDGAAPDPEGDYYTRDEADALFAALNPVDGAFRVSANGQFIQLKDSEDGLWRSIWFAEGVLQIGEPEA